MPAAPTDVPDGISGVVGFAANSNDWHADGSTGVELGSGDGLEVLTEGFPHPANRLTDNQAVFGIGTQLAPLLTGKSASGAFSMHACYAMGARLIAQYFAGETRTQPDTGVELHTMAYDVLAQGVHGTLALSDGVIVRDIPFAKVMALTFAYVDGDYGKDTYGIIGKQMFIDDSTANTTSTIGNVTRPTSPDPKYIYLNSSQLSVWINSDSGALDSDDAIYVSGVTINYQRPVAETRTNELGLLIDEPLGNGWQTVTGTLEFSRDRLSAAQKAWLLNATDLKMRIAVTGQQILATAYNYERIHYFPHIILDADGLSKFDNPGLLKPSIPFRASALESAPTGMTQVQPYMSVQDEVAADHIAA